MTKIKNNLRKAFKAYATRVVAIHNSDNYGKYKELNIWEKERKIILNFIEKNIMYLDFPKAYVKDIIEELWYAKGSSSIERLSEEVLSFVEAKEFVEVIE